MNDIKFLIQVLNSIMDDLTMIKDVQDYFLVLFIAGCVRQNSFLLKYFKG